MKNLTDWSSQLKITRDQLSQITKEYAGKTKGTVYFKRVQQLIGRRDYIKQKVKTLGVTNSIIKCTYHLGVRKYSMYFTEVTIDDARMLVQLREPMAEHITAEQILSGIPSTEKS